MLDLAEETKQCTKCHQAKSVSAFTGRRWWCRQCVSEYNSIWRVENKESQKAKKKAFYANPTNRDRLNATRRKYRANNKWQGIAERNRLKYRLNEDQYAEMIAASRGRCAICNKPTEKLVIDHDHGTGKVRELLCVSCNVGIGNLCDSIPILEAAIAYLKKHGTES